MKRSTVIVTKFKKELLDFADKHNLAMDSRAVEVINRAIFLVNQLKKCKIFMHNLKALDWTLFLENEEWHYVGFIKNKYKKYAIRFYFDETDSIYLYFNYTNNRKKREVELKASDFRRFYR